jgi:hypothetical protein
MRVPSNSPDIQETNRRRNRRGKLFIFRDYLLLGDTVHIGEAALGICFPLKAFSSHPMHPVPHLSFFYLIIIRNVVIKESAMNNR